MPPESIVCLGLNHNTAPIELRERLSCSLSDVSAVLDQGTNGENSAAALGELAIISTCNRMEIYARVDSDQVDARAILSRLLAESRGMELQDFVDHLYYKTGIDCVRHLFTVAAGLDSMVLGEAQILGQVTDGFMVAIEAKTIGPFLTALFRAAIRTGKRARTETAISSNPASISSVAVAKAQQILGDLRNRRPLIVGMGEMGRLAMKALQSRGVNEIAVANRTREVAEAFAEGCGGSVYTMAELCSALADADLVVSATAAPHYIINTELVKAAMANRSGRQLVLVDVAVPRDIDPAVAEVPGVHVFDVDDLQGTLDEALAARQKEAPLVRQIVNEEVVAFKEQMRQITIRPVIAGLRQKAETIRLRELERSMKFLGEVDPKTLEQFQLFSRSLVKKLLHEPTIRLKERASSGESADYADVVSHLFSLETNVTTDQHDN